MTEFLRPEARAALLRWREAGIGLGLMALGLHWALTAFDILFYVGLLLMLGGGLLIWEGIRRARFPGEGGGLGLVEVDERQITYFAPSGGGAVSLDALAAVEIHTTGMGPMASDLFWVFRSEEGPGLMIPGDAENVGALFDALAALPGVDYEAATRAAGTTEPARFVVWQRPARRLH